MPQFHLFETRLATAMSVITIIDSEAIAMIDRRTSRRTCYGIGCSGVYSINYSPYAHRF